jgi:hypothetical protein
MKLKLLAIALLLVTTLIITNSCGNQVDKISFTHPTMKPWFDSKCASCHASGASAASKWKYDASDYDGSIKTHIDHIYQVVYTDKIMPPPSGLDSTNLANFKAWYDAGYPAK